MDHVQNQILSLLFLLTGRLDVLWIDLACEKSFSSHQVTAREFDNHLLIELNDKLSLVKELSLIVGDQELQRQILLLRVIAGGLMLHKCLVWLLVFTNHWCNYLIDGDLGRLKQYFLQA